MPVTMLLIEPFKRKALNLLEEYQAKGMPVENQGQTYPFRQFDEKRMAAIPELNDSLQKFINQKIDLLAFKKAHEVLCRKHNYWGMSSFSGQGFLNQITKWSDASDSVAALLRESFKEPKDRSGCAFAIDEITLRLPKLIQRKGLRLASLPNLVSYFWQIQDPQKFPIYYASAKNILKENDLLKEEKRPGELYLDFWDISEELFDLFSQKVDLKGVNRNWFVEHVLWLEQKKNILPERGEKKKPVQLKESKKESWRDFIPPALSDYEDLSLGSDSLAFERKTILLFKMLGFKTSRYRYSTCHLSLIPQPGTPSTGTDF